MERLDATLGGPPEPHRTVGYEIEHTRAEMDRDLDVLEQKLTPSQLALEAWSLFRKSSRSGAKRLWRIARQHPGPSAVIGAGLAWMLAESLQRRDGSRRGVRRDFARALGYSRRRGYSGYAGTTAPTDYG